MVPAPPPQPSPTRGEGEKATPSPLVGEGWGGGVFSADSHERKSARTAEMASGVKAWEARSEVSSGIPGGGNSGMRSPPRWTRWFPSDPLPASDSAHGHYDRAVVRKRHGSRQTFPDDVPVKTAAPIP